MNDAKGSERGAGNGTDVGETYRFIKKPFFRHKSQRVALAEAAPRAKPDAVRRPAKVARLLALVHHLQAAIDRGTVANRLAMARRLGLTSARVTQLFDLQLLAPDIQESVLTLEAVNGVEPIVERALWEVARAGTWADQRAAWVKLREP